MKQCPYFGQEYSDEATTCSLDQQPLESLASAWSSHLELHSPLTPAECVAKLADAIDQEGFMGFSAAAIFGSKPVVGRVTDSSLRLRKRIYYRNSFQNIFQGTLAPAGSGTVISGRFGLHVAVPVFMYIWFGGVIGIGGVIFVAALRASFNPQAQHGIEWVGLLVPPGLFIFGFALLYFGKYLARDESRYITNFLIRTLNARKTGPAATEK